MPGFANGPGRICSKTVSDRLHIVDWFPTLAALTGAKTNADLDGIDLSPVLFADGSLPERELYWIWSRRPNRWALCLGDWKIVHYGAREPKHPSDWELFYLKTDPKEQRNLADKHPERVSQLHGLFLKQRAKDQ